MKGETNHRISYYKSKVVSQLIKGDKDGVVKTIKKLEGIENDDFISINFTEKILLEQRNYLDLLEIYEKLLFQESDVFKKQSLINKIKELELNFRNELINQLVKRPKKNNEPIQHPFRNIHLIIDSNYSESFMNFVNRNFNIDDHMFILITTTQSEIKYIKTLNHNNLKVLYIENDYLKIVKYISNCTKLFVHFLHDLSCKLIAENEINGEVNWVLWGGDLYSNIDFNLYGPKTSTMLSQILGVNHDRDLSLYKEYHYRKSVIRKIKYIYTWNKGDYELVKKNYITNAQLKFFFYPNPINFKLLDGIKNEGSSLFNKIENDFLILVGNSGDPANNHIEIMEMLAKYTNINFRIITPLSYGNPNYILKIINLGFELFGDRFIPLTQFLNPQEYAKLLNSVDIGFFNHYRQQGVGNILALLYLEKSVFINRNVTTYHSLQNMNINLLEINDIKKFDSLIELLKLNKEKTSANKDNVYKFFNEKILIENLKVNF